MNLKLPFRTATFRLFALLIVNSTNVASVAFPDNFKLGFVDNLGTLATVSFGAGAGVAVGEPSNKPRLTRQQKGAAWDLRCLQEAKIQGLRMGTLRGSYHAFIVGASGSGKTFLARSFARRMNMEFIELNLCSWIVTGAKIEKPTLRVLAERLGVATKPVCLLIDEIDKVRLDKANASDWSRYVTDELMQVLDCRLQLAEGWTEEAHLALQRAFIIGAGSFHEILNAPLSEHEIEEGLTLRHRLDSKQWMPPEVYFRLSTDLIILEPPSRTELWLIAHNALGDALARPATEEEIEAALDEALASGSAMRGLEGVCYRAWRDRQKAIWLASQHSKRQGGDLSQ